MCGRGESDSNMERKKKASNVFVFQRESAAEEAVADGKKVEITVEAEERDLKGKKKLAEDKSMGLKGGERRVIVSGINR